MSAPSIVPNLALLRNALVQAGPWSGDEALSVDLTWLKNALSAAIAQIDWANAAEDVRRFLRPAEQQSLELWSEGFFMAKTQKLG